jgi:hypothetical protein
MVTRKLIAALNKSIVKDLGTKIKLSFDEDMLDSKLIEPLKLIFGTSSTQRVIENAFTHLAIAELERQKSIYNFPSYDYMQKLQSLEAKNLEKDCAVHIPTWMVIALSKIVLEKYRKLEFSSVEEIVNLALGFTAEQTKCLWHPDL